MQMYGHIQMISTDSGFAHLLNKKLKINIYKLCKLQNVQRKGIATS